MTLEHRSKIGKFLSYSLLTLIAIAFLFPFAWMLASSLKPTSEVFSSGASLTGTRLAWDNYTEATQQIPLGRMGAPEDVARAVAFFASEESSYVTGQVLAVDGGMMMC